jgi:hypothetical protein
MTIEITVDESGDAEFAATIEAIVDEPAARRGHPFDPVPLHLKAVDADGRLAGGLTAHSVQRWLFVKLLGVTEGQRDWTNAACQGGRDCPAAGACRRLSRHVRIPGATVL